MAVYDIPSFLKNRSTDEIYERIKTILPKDIDLSEGGHGWNMTRPIALVAAEMCEYILPEVIKLIIPETSYGDFLDGHAKSRGIYRNEATAATGEVTITGTPDSFIPAGSLFSVPAVNDEPSVDYATLEDVTIPQDGFITVGVICTKTGRVGNTGANTIVLVSSKLTGISGVNNNDAIEGGTERESDEQLLEEINEYDKTQGYSFVGNEADYIRWAKEAGAGGVSLVTPEDDSGHIYMYITDSEGRQPSPDLIAKVENYIMMPDNREQRRAPIGASLTVDAPGTCEIAIKATIELDDMTTIASVKELFEPAMALYLSEALDEGEIKYSRVWAVLAGIKGVADFKGLQIGTISNKVANYGTSNIKITDNLLPTLSADNINFTVGEV